MNDEYFLRKELASECVVLTMRKLDSAGRRYGVRIYSTQDNFFYTERASNEGFSGCFRIQAYGPLNKTRLSECTAAELGEFVKRINRAATIRPHLDASLVLDLKVLESKLFETGELIVPRSKEENAALNIALLVASTSGG